MGESFMTFGLDSDLQIMTSEVNTNKLENSFTVDHNHQLN